MGRREQGSCERAGRSRVDGRQGTSSLPPSCTAHERRPSHPSEPAVKRCSSCQKRKPVDSFYQQRSTPDGRMYRCKACTLQARSGKLDTKGRRRHNVSTLQNPPLTEGGWRARAACKQHDPIWWAVPSKTTRARAIKVCWSCPVRAECAAQQKTDIANGLLTVGIYAGREYRLCREGVRAA